jgi:hypothetical protein
MKKSPLILAVLLATGGAALAADTSYKSGDTSMNSDTTTTQSGDTLGAKTRRGAHKVGQAIKDTGHEVAAAAHRVTHPRERGQASTSYGGDNTDMRSNDTGYDGARRQRMDSAYANWQARQNKS